MAIKKKGKIKGIITDCITGEEKSTVFDYIIENIKDDHKVFRLIGGPTGYEDFLVDDGERFGITEHGWTASMGTKGLYDKLFIPAEEMKKALGEEK